MMVVVTQGVVAACSAAKAMGTRAEARRRRVLKNCIVVVLVVVWYVCGVWCVVFGVDIDVDCLLIRRLEKSEWGW